MELWAVTTSGSVPPPSRRSLCRDAKEKCESVLSIVGLQWPEDSDCSQFPEDGGDAACLLPEDGVDGMQSEAAESEGSVLFC